MRILQIFRDGRRFQPIQQQSLQPGTQGNLQTLKYMAQIVREDRLQMDLRAFVLREIVGNAKGFDFNTEVESCFHYAQHKIIYRKDPVQVERVADIWSTLYFLNPNEPEGDCGIKSTFLASCLAILGHKPFFYVVKQNELSTNFNHVYVGVEMNGKQTALDPTPQDAPVGREPRHLLKAIYPIFK